MSETKLKILAVVGSLHASSVTRTVVNHLAKLLHNDTCTVDLLDFEKEPLALFNPDTARAGHGFAALRARVDAADVILLGTPDYHGSISSTTKNFLDHFWHEFAGKLFVTVVASHEKGLTTTDQLRTVARQCYAWTLPYGVSFMDGHDVKDGQIISDSFKKRIDMMVRDTQVYGKLLARQRHADMHGSDPCFMAKMRPTTK